MEYLTKARDLLERLERQSSAQIAAASDLMAGAIAAGRPVHVFGSGHSVIPALDVFPRYGSFVGFHPLLDPRLMWFNVVGAGGAPELLWIERQEGYVEQFLAGQDLRQDDVLLVFSHGGLNAAPVEAALYAKSHGLAVVAVTSLSNAATHAATHSSGKRLGDVADVTIDNAVPPEDALVWPPGAAVPIAAGSTLAVVAVVGCLVSEVGLRLGARGAAQPTFVSPNVAGVGPDHNRAVFAAYREFMARPPA
jgi:uncharacterized phosphosugar-binding protein